MKRSETLVGTGQSGRRHRRAFHLLIAFLLILASSLVIAGTAAAQAVIATIPVGLGPYGAAANPGTNRVYVANGNANSVSVIDGTVGSPTENQVIATIPVNVEPIGVAVNPSTNHIYVTNQMSNKVSVIDGATNAVVGSIAVGSGPFGVTVNPSTNRVYVANSLSNTVSVIDGSTNTVVASVSIGSQAQPVAIDVNPATNRVYVANYGFGASSVSVIDGSSNQVVATIPVGSNPSGVAVNPNTNRVYVANSNILGAIGTVSVIDGGSNQVIATVTVGSKPKSVAINLATGNAFVTNNGSGTVSVIDPASNSVSATVPVGPGPFGVAANKNTNRVYVTNNGNSSVSVIHDSNSQTTTATTTTVGNATTQYSDPVTLSATVSPKSFDGQTLTGTVAFTINGTSVGSAAVDGNGVAKLTVPSVLLAAGDYPIKATFSSTNSRFSDSQGTGTLTVTREDATVTPLSSDPFAVKVNSPGGSAGPVTLGATIAESADATLGDISKAVPVSFTLSPIGPGTTYTCVSPSGSVSGKTVTVSCTFANLTVNVYKIQIEIGGSYYHGSADPTLMVYDSSNGFITGGGTVSHDGARANLSFEVKYLPDGQPRGTLQYVEHRQGGDVVVKSSAIAGMTIVSNKISYVEGSATVNGEGKYSFLMTAVDNGEPGKNDQFGLQVKDSHGTIIASLTFSSTTLTGGNLVVGHK